MFDPYHKWLGIPAKDQPPNHYRLLGIELFETDGDVIDAAANKQMAYVQGCATGPHTALSQTLLNEIAAARLCLLTPAKKADYDAKLKASLPKVSIPLAMPVAIAPPSSSQEITANAPAPASSNSKTDDEPFDVLMNEPDLGGRKRWKRQVKKWPIIIGCILLGVGGLSILAIYSLPMISPSKAEKRHAELPGKKVGEQKPIKENPKTQKKDASDKSLNGKKGESVKNSEIHILVKIDGTDTLRISEQDGLWIHGTHAWPTLVKINNLDWTPMTNPRFAKAGISKLLGEKVDFSTAMLSVKKGRGRVELKKSNDHVDIHFDDYSHPGADTYEVVVSFGKQ